MADAASRVRETRATGASNHARAPAKAATPPLHATVLALQRAIGNARVARALRQRRLQRTYADDIRALLGTPLFAGDARTAPVLQALQTPLPTGGLREFTRHDAARWIEGEPTLAEWDDPTVNVLRDLAFEDPLKARAFKDVGNRDALREMKAVAAQVLVDLDALLQNSPGAGAPWTQKFTALRATLVTLKGKIDARHYDASLAAFRDTQKDAYRTAFATAAEEKLAELRSIALQVRIGGRLKFSQKRANYKFSDAATVNNAATSALVAGKLVSTIAADLRANRIHPDRIPVQVFFHNGELVSINNRGLSALSLAGLRPTNVILAAPSQDILNRIGESDTFHGAGTITSPDFRIALTKTDAATDKVAEEVPVTV